MEMMDPKVRRPPRPSSLRRSRREMLVSSGPSSIGGFRTYDLKDTGMVRLSKG
jgi:hypothetical protein